MTRRGVRQVLHLLGAASALAAVFLAGSPQDVSAQPTLRVSTFFGGVQDDIGRGVAVDSLGFIYVTGTSRSLDLPTTAGAYRRTPDTIDNSYDIYVAKLDPTGRTLLWSTWIGGSGDDDPEAGIQIAPDGSLVVAGSTTSRDFPTTTDAVQGMPTQRSEGFVLRLSPDGAELLWATYLGGTGVDRIVDFGFDVQENVVVGGRTTSDDLQIPTDALFPSRIGGVDAFVMRLLPSGDSIATGTYFGGTNDDTLTAIAVDPGGETHLTGWTLSGNIPTSSDAAIGSLNGSSDAFVATIAFDHRSLAYGTFLGGGADERGQSIDRDNGGLLVTGHTSSNDFPNTTNSNTGSSWFATRITIPGGGIDWSTILSSDALTEGRSIRALSDGSVAVVGATVEPGFPTAGDGVEIGPGGADDIAIALVGQGGQPLNALSWIGGNATDLPAEDVALGVTDELYLTGTTFSADYPTSRFPFDELLNDGIQTAPSDAFVLGWSHDPAPVMSGRSILMFDTLDCETAALDSLYIYNDGTDTVTIIANFFDDAEEGFELIQPQEITDIPLAPGDSLLYVIELSKDDVGVSETDLLIYSSDSLSGRSPYPVRVSAVRNTSSVVVAPRPLRFGNVLTCSDSTVIVTLFNDGKGPATVRNPRFLSASGAFRIESDTLFPETIQERGSLQFRLVFDPDAPGLYLDTLQFDLVECPGTIVSAPLSGRGEFVSLSGLPDTVDFGVLAFCDGSADTTVLIENDGSVAMNISELSTIGAFTIRNQGSDTLNPGDSRLLQLRFVPDSIGMFEGVATLGVTPCDTAYTVVLRGRQPGGLPPSPLTDTIRFDTVVSCAGSLASTSLNVEIENPSDNAVLFDPPSFESPFEFCGLSFPEWIDPGSSVDLCLRYRPFDAGRDTFMLEIPFQIDGCHDTIRYLLTGLHLIPELTVESTSIDFGTLPACTTGRDTTIVVRNPSGAAITMASSQLTPGAQIVAPALPVVVPARDSVDVTIRFQPTASGSSSEEVSLILAPCDDTLTFDVTGFASGYVVTSNPATLDLGPQFVCDSPIATLDSLDLVRTGESADPVTIDEIRMQSASGVFTIANRTALIDSELDESNPVAVSISFAPDVPGVIRDTVLVTIEPCGEVLRIPVEGLGVEPVLMASSGNFGDVDLGLVGRRTIVLTNNTPLPIALTELELPDVPFTVDTLGLDLPRGVAPGGFIELDAEFTPEEERSWVDSIIATLDVGCAVIQSIGLRGRGVQQATPTEFCVRGLYAEPGRVGDTVSIRPSVDPAYDHGGTFAVSITLAFDPNRFEFVGVDGGSLDQLDDVAGTVTASNSAARILPDDLPSVRLRLLAGPYPFGVVRIDSVAVDINEISASVCDTHAIVTIVDHCLVSGISLGRFSNKLDRPAPNPASGRVQLSFQQLEDARTTVSVFDMSGRRVSVPLQSYLPGGRYEIEFGVDDLPPGLYFVRVHAGEWSDVVRLRIER